MLSLHVIPVLALIVSASPATSAPALSGAADDPLLTLRRADARLAAAFNWRIPDWAPEAAVRQARIHRLLAGLIDYQEIARRTLEPPAWEALGPAERRAFVDAFTALAGHAFLANLICAETHQSYESESVAGDNARVIAQAVSRDGRRGSARQIEYRLCLAGRQWRVTDVIVDGTSLVDSYRRQFSRLIKHEGISGLIARMRDRQARQAAY